MNADRLSRDPVRREGELIAAAFAQEEAAADTPPGRPRALPDAVGPYRIVREVGSGGMGLVYEARQEWPIRRRVALKVIKLGMDTQAVVARFEAERQALALMDHPNVARIFDAGATDQGQPYFAMEYIDGVRITRYCDGERLSLARRLQLFIPVCQAVQHAHQKGIIHRDLKPSNILVAVEDGHPLPKIIDFGVAKATRQRLTEYTLFTEQGQFVGTPEYMSPEQFDSGVYGVDTRTDVYALGVLLYEMIVGALPYGATEFSTRGLGEIRRIICETEPPAPSVRLARLGSAGAVYAGRRAASVPALLARLRGDLDWIVMKALAKEREQRYASAAELAEDIRRYLAGEPVSARPPTAAYRLRRFVGRNRLLVGGTALLGLLLSAGVVTTVLFALAQTRAKRQADWQTYRISVTAAQAALNLNDVRTARRNLAAALPELRAWEWRHLLAECDRSLATFAGHTGTVTSVAYSPDGAALATGGKDATVRLWDTAHGRVTTVLHGHEGAVNDVQFSPDGGNLASAAADKTIRLWEVRGEAPPRMLQLPTEEARAIAFSPDGTRLAVGEYHGTARLYDTVTGLEQGVFPGPLAQAFDVAFSPDGRQLAVPAFLDMNVRLWDVAAGTERTLSLNHRGGVYAVAFSPDGARLATASQDHTVRVWDVATGAACAFNWKHTSDVTAVCFYADGEHLASASRDTTVRILRASDADEVALLRGHEAGVCALALSPDGRRLASAGEDQTVRIWDASPAQELSLLHSREAVFDLAFSPDGTRLAAAALWNRSVSIWDTGTGDELAVLQHAGPVRSVAFSADGSLLVTSCTDRTLHVWDAHTGAELRVFQGPTEAEAVMAMHPRRAYLAAGYADGTVHIRDLATGTVQASPSGVDGAVKDLAFSPDGARLAAATSHGTVHVWNASSGYTLAYRASGTEEVRGVAFSPDGRHLATSDAKAIRIWDTATGALRSEWPGEAGPLAYSPDGARLAAVAQFDVCLWDTATGQPLITLDEPVEGVHAIAFSPDGTCLAEGGENWVVRIWDTVPYRERYALKQAIRAAEPAARRIVDGMWDELGDARTVAARLQQERQLDEATRRAALNLVLRRAAGYLSAE